VAQVALGIGLMGLDQGDVGKDAALKDCRLAVELHDFLALGNGSSHTGWREEGRNTNAASAQTLGQGALRAEFDFQIPVEELLGEELILANVGSQHLGD